MTGMLAALLIALSLAGAVRAETVRSEGIGTAPLPGAPGVSPRSAALDAALRDAVQRVAEQLAGDAPGPAAEAALREALSPNPARFAVSYRGVSEIERARANGTGRELAVSVEALVDRALVADALRRAGLLAAQAEAPSADAAHHVVLEPVPSWQALTALRQRLIELGARRVTLERVEPERAVLSVDADRSVESLVRAAIEAPPRGVEIAASGDQDGVLRIRLELVPLAPGIEPAAIDTPAVKR